MRMRRAIARVTLLAFLGALPGGPARADVTGVEVVQGSAQVHQEGKLTRIQQASDVAILQMQSLSVAPDETLFFDQPGASSRTLNRVLGGDASVISGRVVAPGSVYIVNLAGVYFRGTPILDVGNLVAAAGKLADADFLAGRDRFTELSGPVENSGEIHAAGDLSLLGARVENQGTILAPRGLVAFVAGDRVLLARLDGHLQVQVDAGPPQPAGDPVGGGAPGGLATGDLYSLAINHSGITRAREIHAEATGEGLVRVAGQLDASAVEPGQRGGRIAVSGDLVSLEGARLDVSGSAGGGEIRVGGDWRGQGPLRAARRTAVDPASQLRADALDAGDGGSAVVWSQEATGFSGALSARGGAAGGNGGRAEISGEHLVADGEVDLGAARGARGSLLYDPREILIQGGSQDGSDAPNTDPDHLTDATGTSVSILFGDTGSADPFQIFESEIEGTDANLVLEARHGISAAGSFSHDADGAGSLDAGNTLLLADGRSLTLRTRNQAGDEQGAALGSGIDVSTGGLLVRTTGGGNLTLETGSSLTGTTPGNRADIRVAALQTESGDVQLTTRNGQISADSIDTRGSAGAQRAGGNVVVQAGTASAPGNFQAAGISIAGGISARGADEVAAAGGDGGDVTLDSRGDGSLSVGGAIDSRGGAGVSAGGAGGDVVLGTRNGGIQLASIDSSGGDASAGNGGLAGRAVADAAAPTGKVDVQVTGPIRADGGDGGSDATSRGGSSNSVRMRSADGGASVAEIQASGGSGNAAGGNAVDVAVNAGDGDVTLNGAIAALSGSSPGSRGAAGSVRLLASGNVIDARPAGTALRSDGRVSVDAAVVGSDAAPLQLEALAAPVGSTTSLEITANGSVDASAAGAGFDSIALTQRSAAADASITNAGDTLAVAGGASGSTVTNLDTRTRATDVSYSLEAGSGGALLVASARAAGDLTLASQGDVSSSAPIEASSNLSLRGATVGNAAPVQVDGGGSADSALALAAAGKIDVQVTRRGFDVFDITQAKPDAPVQLTQEGGDFVTGTPRDASSQALSADTRPNQVALAYRLGSPLGSPAASEVTAADLVIPVDGVKLGGDAFLESTRDIVLGEGGASGTAILMAPGSKLTLHADLDQDAADRGAVRDGVSGGSGEIATGGDTGEVLIGAGDGIGAAADPIALRGGAVLSAVSERGDLALENRGSGELTLRDLTHTAPGQSGRSLNPGSPTSTDIAVQVQKGANAPDISLANQAGGLRVEGLVSGPLDSAGSDVTLAAAGGSAIRFALAPPSNPNLNLASVLTGGRIHVASDAVAVQNTLLVSQSGDIDLDGSIDAASAGGADFSAFSPGGTTRFGDGSGTDRIGGQAALSELNSVGNATAGPVEFRVSEVHAEDGIRAFGAARILAAETRFDSQDGAVRFESTLDGPGSAVVDRSGAGVVFAGDVGATSPLARLEVNTGSTIEFGGTRVAAGSGGIALNPAGRPTPPPRAGVFKRGGDLAFVTPGRFQMGRREKLSVAGNLQIQAARAELSDLNAQGLSVVSPDIALLGRGASDVELQGGGSVRDTGLDLVANSMRFSSTPVFDGVGQPARLFTATGSVRPNPIPGTESRLIDGSGHGLAAADFAPGSGAGALDLTGSGPPVRANPAGQSPVPTPPVPTGRPPDFSEEAPATRLASDPAPILAALAAGPDAAAWAGVEPALRGRLSEAARLYGESFGESAEHLEALRAFRLAVTVAGDRSGPGLRRAAEQGRDSAAALRYLEQIGRLLTQLRLLEVTPEAAAELRRQVLERAVQQLQVAGLDPGALGNAADPESPGFRFSP